MPPLHREPYCLRHPLAAHPLFEPERLVELARSLPASQVEYNRGDVSLSQRPEETPRLDLPADEIIASLEHANAWLVIFRPDVDPEYADVLEGFLGELASQSGHAKEDFQRPESFFFLSSPGATTPFHIDPEHNVLAQIRGRKEIHVFDDRDCTLVPEAQREEYRGKHRNQPYEPRFEERARAFELAPGEGLHIPYGWPHWVRNGSEPSVSFSMTWRTRESLRLFRLRRANAALRRVGFPQPAPGDRPSADRSKVFAVSALAKLRKPGKSPGRSRKRVQVRSGRAARLAQAGYWLRDLARSRRWARIEAEDGFDQRFGTDTRERDPARNYSATPERSFTRILEVLPPHFQTGTFIDLGSGKGRAVLMACRAPFEQLIGVELSREFHEIAQANLAQAARQAAWVEPARVNFVCADAVDFVEQQWPSGATVTLFMFCPFAAGVLPRVAERIAQQVARNQQDLAIVFLNPSRELADVEASWVGLERIHESSREAGRLSAYEDFQIFVFHASSSDGERAPAA